MHQKSLKRLHLGMRLVLIARVQLEIVHRQGPSKWRDLPRHRRASAPLLQGGKDQGVQKTVYLLVERNPVVCRWKNESRRVERDDSGHCCRCIWCLGACYKDRKALRYHI